MLLDAGQSLTKEVLILPGHTLSTRFGKKSAFVIVFVFVSVFSSIIISFYCDWTRDHLCPRSPGGATGHTWSTRLGKESACVIVLVFVSVLLLVFRPFFRDWMLVHRLRCCWSHLVHQAWWGIRLCQAGIWRRGNSASTSDSQSLGLLKSIF